MRQAHYFKLTFHNTELNCCEAEAQAALPAAAASAAVRIRQIKRSLKVKLNGEKRVFSAYFSKGQIDSNHMWDPLSLCFALLLILLYMRLKSGQHEVLCDAQRLTEWEAWSSRRSQQHLLPWTPSRNK